MIKILITHWSVVFPMCLVYWSATQCFCVAEALNVAIVFYRYTLLLLSKIVLVFDYGSLFHLSGNIESSHFLALRWLEFGVL